MRESLIAIRLADGVQVNFDKIADRSEAKILLCKQVHGKQGWRISKTSAPDQEGDWLWTTEPKMDLGILVADCTAIMVSGVLGTGENFLGAIHAGWRGTAAGIISTAFETWKPRKFSAWLSPSICQEHFEVGGEVIEALGGKAKNFARATGKAKFLLDLKAFQIDQIKAWGGDVHSSSLCTFCQPEFLSYRRAKGHLEARHLVSISNP